MKAKFHPALNAIQADDLGRVNSWSQDRQGVINNAFVYACMHGHIIAAKLLLDKGAPCSMKLHLMKFR